MALGGLEVAILTWLIVTFLNIMIGSIVFIFWFNRRKNNNIDVSIYELTKDSFQHRREIGRFLDDPKLGRILVTAKLFSNSIKDKLGPLISDNDLVTSKKAGRKFVAVAVKDGMISPLKRKLESSKLSEKELESINKLLHPNKVSLKEIPQSLGLSPIKSEQIRFVLDAKAEALETYKDKNAEAQRFIMKALGVGFVLLVVGTIAIVAILLTQGPQAVEQISSAVPKNPLPPV